MKYSAEEKAVLRRFAQSGGKARAKALSPAQRVAIAKQGATARWAKVKKLTPSALTEL